MCIRDSSIVASSVAGCDAVVQAACFDASAFRPGRDAQVQFEGNAVCGTDCETDMAIVGVAGFLLNRKMSAIGKENFGTVFPVYTEPERILRAAVGILAGFGNGSGQVGQMCIRDSGVPTVVGAATIVFDTVDALIQALSSAKSTEFAAEMIEEMDMEEKHQLIRELLEPRFGPMFVTPKDIDASVKRLSFTISEGINIAMFA